MKRLVLFFLRWPEPGQVKTRLAREVGDEAAAALARAMAEDMLDTLRWVEDADLAVCFTPKGRGADMAAWLGAERDYWPQRGPELGRRMRNGFITAFGRGYEQVVLVGSDVPDMHDDDVRAAFDHLDTLQSCAIGPSTDGGYWLIGFDRKGFLDEAFIGMDWSGPLVLEQTLRRLEFDERTVGRVTERTDVDTLDDLRRVVSQGTLRPGSATLRLARALPGF